MCRLSLLLILTAVAAGAAQSDRPNMTLHVIPQAHIDLAWWWRYDPETLDIVVKHTLETAYQNMEKFPEYTFTHLQVPAIEPLETAYPDLFYKLRYYVHSPMPMRARIPNPDASGAKGRLAIGSGLWCEADGCVPCGESLVRQCLYGKRYFQKAFGVDVKTAWFQDAWTHPWTYPQILKKSGIDSFMFSRPRGQGENMFWWEGPDGSRVFAYKPLDVGGESLPSQDKIDARLVESNRRYGVTGDITLIGVGNHGGGAIRADVQRMRTAMEDHQTPKMVFSTPADFVQAVLRDAHDFPVTRDELPATIRGAYTSQAEIKKGNRTCENLLMTIEKFSAIGSWLGVRPYPQQALYDAWKTVMLNQFHDTISGTDILPATEDALRGYESVENWGRAELNKCLGAITARINTQGRGTPIIVFNPLAWPRTDIVEAQLPCRDDRCVVTLIDQNGKAAPVQCASDGSILRFAFLARDVPSLGYQTYWANVEPGPRKSQRPAGDLNLENEFFRVEIDPETGCLARIYDKENKREVLDGSRKGNLIQILEDYGDSEGFLKSADGTPEHNVWDGPSRDVASDPKIAWIERGPVRFTIEVKKGFDLARFTQRVTLCPGLPRIDFEMAVDWEGKNKMVKVAFPFAVSPAEAAYEIPYGAINRPSKGEESAAQAWVDLTQNGYGVSFLNDSRYGYDVSGNVARLSVLRSPTRPVAATEEQGVHTLRYAIYPHQGSWQRAGTVQRGYEFNSPLIAVADTPHNGDLPPRCAFLQVEPCNVVATVLKKGEGADDLILRCYESAGEPGRLRVTLVPPLRLDAVHATDLLENSQSEVPVDGNAFQTETRPWSIETFKLIRD